MERSAERQWDFNDAKYLEVGGGGMLKDVASISNAAIGQFAKYTPRSVALLRGKDTLELYKL